MHRLALKAPQQGTIQNILKRVGDSASFGEPVLVFKEGVELVSPVAGQVVQINSKIGDSIPINADLMLFEGRRPSIQFRYGGNRPSPSTTPLASNDESKQQQSPKPSGNNKVIKDFMSLPPNFGRLPPLTKKEETLLISGGAYDS